MNKEEMALDAVKTVAEQFFDGNFTDMIRFIERESENILV